MLKNTSSCVGVRLHAHLMQATWGFASGKCWKSWNVELAVFHLKSDDTPTLSVVAMYESLQLNEMLGEMSLRTRR